MHSMTTIYGHYFDFHKPTLQTAILTIQNGIIANIHTSPTEDEIQKCDYIFEDSVITPVFIDSHVHYPQTKIIGSASGPLLPWLNATVFPEEARFSTPEYARQVAMDFCEQLIAAGTGGACIYSSPHFEATDILFEVLAERGLKAMVGLTLMDTSAPSQNLHSIDYAKTSMEKLIQKWHGFDNNRLRYCVTPRFALSCSSEMLNLAGQISTHYDLWIQTHLSENKEEVQIAKNLFPGISSYLGVYDHFGLLHEKSLFAHCIYVEDKEWDLFIDKGAVVSHNPDSNFFLGSGSMSFIQIYNKCIPITMGSDVGAGRSFSLKIAGGRAYDASLIHNKPISALQALDAICGQGSNRLGFGGSISIGEDADLSVFHYTGSKDISSVAENIMFDHSNLRAQAVFVRGKKL